MTTHPRIIDDSAPNSGSIECPRCASAMRHQSLGDIQIDVCQSCAGLWLDVLEKDKLLEAGHAAAADNASPRHPNAPKGRTLKCPRDRSTMLSIVAFPQTHIAYESCTVCGGMFFDSGELKDLSEHTLRERVRAMFNRK